MKKIYLAPTTKLIDIDTSEAVAGFHIGGSGDQQLGKKNLDVGPGRDDEGDDMDKDSSTWGNLWNNSWSSSWGNLWQD